jgi:DNA polymerase III subunit gamma/tau
MLGSTGRQALLDILQAITTGDHVALLDHLAGLEAQAPDYAALLNDMAAYVQRMAVLQVLPHAQSDEDDATLLSLKDRVSLQEAQLYYQILIHGRRDLPWAPDPRSGFEMTVLRLFAFRPEEAGGENAPPTSGAKNGDNRGVAAPQSAEVGLSSGRLGSPFAAQPVVTTAPPPLAPLLSVAPALVAADAGQPVDGLPSGLYAVQDSGSLADELDSVSWDIRLHAMELDGLTRQLARHCAWHMCDGRVVTLVLDPAFAHLLQEDRRQAIEHALSIQSKRPIQLRIVLSDNTAMLETPAKIARRQQDADQRALHAEVASDPVVLAFQHAFCRYVC